MSAPAGPRVKVSPDALSAAAAAAAEISGQAWAAVTDRGSFTLAVSGGRSPGPMLAGLAADDMPWAQATIFQVDERIAAADDPSRNLTGLLSALPGAGASRVVPMPVDADDLDSACVQYATALPTTLDLIHLGLGADGHTASLVPGDPVLDVHDLDVALTGQYQDRRRMTLTYPRIARARAILWLVTGADKGPALARLLAHDPEIPAGRVANPTQVLFCDAAAADAAGLAAVLPAAP